MKTPEEIAGEISVKIMAEMYLGGKVSKLEDVIEPKIVQAIQDERLLLLELYQCLKPLAELCLDIKEGDNRKTVALFAPGRGVQNVITYGQILDARKAMRHFGK